MRAFPPIGYGGRNAAKDGDSGRSLRSLSRLFPLPVPPAGEAGREKGKKGSHSCKTGSRRSPEAKATASRAVALPAAAPGVNTLLQKYRKQKSSNKEIRKSVITRRHPPALPRKRQRASEDGPRSPQRFPTRQQAAGKSYPGHRLRPILLLPPHRQALPDPERQSAASSAIRRGFG